ncbi:MAG: hypothetical protein ACRDV0_05870 [Acidimicrobiales bacterium]
MQTVVTVTGTVVGGTKVVATGGGLVVAVVDGGAVVTGANVVVGVVVATPEPNDELVAGAPLAGTAVCPTGAVDDAVTLPGVGVVEGGADTGGGDDAVDPDDDVGARLAVVVGGGGGVAAPDEEMVAEWARLATKSPDASPDPRKRLCVSWRTRLKRRRRSRW